MPTAPHTYTLNPNDGDFKALTGGGVGSEVFTYTLTDADGDVSTATPDPDHQERR